MTLKTTDNVDKDRIIVDTCIPKVEEASPRIQNQILAALPQNEFDEIASSLKLVDLERDQVLWEMDEKRKHIYFPTTVMICMLYDTEDGDSIEVGMTGRQGMVGIVTFVGDARMAKRAVVMNSGQAYIMKANDAEKYFGKLPCFQEICLCYTQTLIVQLSQGIICNRLHSIDQQLCRYLLIYNDMLRSTVFHLTQARISNVLGVRRESISTAAAQLQAKGLIKYTHGKIELLDRKSLLAAACECYQVVKEQNERILGKYFSRYNA